LFIFIIRHEVLMFKPVGMIAATIGICEAEDAGSEGSRCRALATTIAGKVSIVEKLNVLDICREIK